MENAREGHAASCRSSRAAHSDSSLLALSAAFETAISAHDVRPSIRLSSMAAPGCLGGSSLAQAFEMLPVALALPIRSGGGPVVVRCRPINFGSRPFSLPPTSLLHSGSPFFFFSWPAAGQRALLLSPLFSQNSVGSLRGRRLLSFGYSRTCACLCHLGEQRERKAAAATAAAAAAAANRRRARSQRSPPLAHSCLALDRPIGFGKKKEISLLEKESLALTERYAIDESRRCCHCSCFSTSGAARGGNVHLCVQVDSLHFGPGESALGW